MTVDSYFKSQAMSLPRTSPKEKEMPIVNSFLTPKEPFISADNSIMLTERASKNLLSKESSITRANKTFDNSIRQAKEELNAHRLDDLLHDRTQVLPRITSNHFVASRKRVPTLKVEEMSNTTHTVPQTAS